MASETTQSPPILFTIQNLPYSPQKACEYWFLETKVLVGGACISFPVPLGGNIWSHLGTHLGYVLK